MAERRSIGDRGHRLRLDGPGAQPLVPPHPDAVPRARLRPTARRSAPTTWRRGATRRPTSFGFAEVTDDWRRVVDHPDVDVVIVTAPNMLHEELCVAAAGAGKHLFCEKPVGGTPEQTVRVAAATRRAGIITGVGYNYRWVPLVMHARELVASGPARRDHQLPGPLLLDVRQRSARPAVVALPPGRGRLRRVERHPQPRRRSRPPTSSARSREVVGTAGDVHPPSARCRRGRRHALRPGPTRRPHRRGDERGLRRRPRACSTAARAAASSARGR